jgi:hypothetical protein
MTKIPFRERGIINAPGDTRMAHAEFIPNGAAAPKKSVLIRVNRLRCVRHWKQRVAGI